MTTTRPCIIFDLDGTLAYTIEDLKNSINRMCDHFGWPNITVEDALRNINSGARAFVRGCMPEDLRKNNEAADRAYEVYAAIYQEEHLKTTCLYPFVAEGLHYLREQGVRMAVFSNKNDEQTKAICQKLIPPGTFELVLGYDGTYPHKPSPEGALAIAAHFKAKAEDVILVGDSDVDMNLAANAGMRPVGVSWGYRPPELLRSLGAERILSSLEDIKALID